MANITFEWQPWFQKKTNPRAVGEKIVALAKQQNGRIHEDELVKEAEKKESPLHEFFEWDDKRAANFYRSQQARSLLGGLKVTVKIEDNIDPSLSTKTQVKFIPEVGEKTTIYTITSSKLEEGPQLFSVPKKEQVFSTRLERARSELRIFRKMYQDLEELNAVFTAIDKFLTSKEVKKAA